MVSLILENLLVKASVSSVKASVLPVLEWMIERASCIDSSPSDLFFLRSEERRVGKECLL